MKAKSSSTHKKVVLETFQGERHAGYVNPKTFDRDQGLELLDAGGQLQQFEWKKVKVAWFVRDWDGSVHPEQTAFTRRPRLEGLWVRLRFRDEEILEGMLINDLLHVSKHGYLITPPDLSGNQQKAFVPKAALESMNVLAVIPNRGERHRRRRARTLETVRQPLLFTE
jgi:hypothetical protein